MHFNLVDRVLEQTTEKIVTLKNVSLAEEYLQDHFATFPVLPGVMMLESMVQAARRLIESLPASRTDVPYVLGKVRALKYGTFVKPGHTMRVTVTLRKDPGDGTYDLDGLVEVLDPASPSTAATAASGRLALRPARLTNA